MENTVSLRTQNTWEGREIVEEFCEKFTIGVKKPLIASGSGYSINRNLRIVSVQIMKGKNVIHVEIST